MIPHSSTHDSWQSPATPPPLLPGEVHLWRIPLPAILPHLDLAPHSLPSHEIERAATIRHLPARQQFLAARLFLRHLLARHLAVHPSAVPIQPGLHQKPQLSDPHTLAFNLAHTADAILLALTLTGPIGIDIESLTPTTPFLEIARHSFTPAETIALESLPTALQPQAFLHLWTRKEALTKADGRGLGVPLSSFTVPLTPAQNTPITLPKSTPTLFLTDVPLPPGLAAAVAVPFPNPDVKLMTFLPGYLESFPKLSMLS